MYVSILLLYVRYYLPRMTGLQWILVLLFAIYLMIPVTLVCCIVSER
jgi:hypothetical protein